LVSWNWDSHVRAFLGVDPQVQESVKTRLISIVDNEMHVIWRFVSFCSKD
jgi:hypothetical protein